MNKTLAIVTVAILLGTVTIVVPLTLLGTNPTIPDAEYTARINDTEGKLQLNTTISGGTSEKDNTLPPSNETNPEPTITLDGNKTEATSDLSPIAWMTIPSLAVAAAVFVYLKKRGY